jgi:hypothetical protein
MKGIPSGKNKGRNVSTALKGKSETNVVAGGAASGGAYPQKPFAGPASSGQPSSMKKALAKKSSSGKGI